jgi:poly-gamma-glutamate synthesis protein (capsule biosynthesis protein)
MLNLANNHITNQGIEGLLYTRNLLLKNQMLPVGVGKDLDEAWRGQVFSIKGIRIGFIGATYYSGSNNNNVALIQDTDRLITAINELKSRSDFIVVTMHAGEEYVRTPNQSQINFAKTAIDNGADLVIGAHPHWVQTIEQYKQKYIFYSLGNFIFDQMWSQDTREGLMLKITLSKKGLCHPRLNPNSPTPLSRSEQINLVCTTDLQGSTEPAKLKTIELVPIIIENYGQPRIANELEKQNILNKIGATTNVITPKH